MGHRFQEKSDEAHLIGAQNFEQGDETHLIGVQNCGQLMKRISPVLKIFGS